MGSFSREGKSNFRIVKEYFAKELGNQDIDNIEEHTPQDFNDNEVDQLAVNNETEYIEPILLDTILQELNNIVSESDLNKATTDSRARITAYLTANLFIKEYDRCEVNAFCDIMRNEYITGNFSIQQCYDKYLETRRHIIRDNELVLKPVHKTDETLNIANDYTLVVRNQLIEIDQVKEVVERLTQHKLVSIRGRQILFEGVNKKKQKFILYTPKSRYYSNYGSWWIDINRNQYDIMKNYDECLFVFRLENSQFSCFLWSEISELINEKCMISDPKSGQLWRLYIYPHYIKIWNNDKVLTTDVKHTDYLIATINNKLKE